MKATVARTKKISTTLKIFLLCFVVYLVCNAYSK